MYNLYVKSDILLKKCYIFNSNAMVHGGFIIFWGDRVNTFSMRFQQASIDFGRRAESGPFRDFTNFSIAVMCERVRPSFMDVQLRN